MNKNQHLLRNWIHRKVYCQYFCVFVAKASIWLKWETGKYWLCRTLLKMERERVSPCLVSWLRSWLTFWVSLNLDYTNTTIKPFLICTFKISRLKQENSKQESCIHLWQVNWVLFCFVLFLSQVFHHQTCWRLEVTWGFQGHNTFLYIWKWQKVLEQYVVFSEEDCFLFTWCNNLKTYITYHSK